MQNIQAKKESLMRLLGMILILFGLLITLILDYVFVMTNLIMYLMILLIIIPWLVLIILLKLEKDFIVDHAIIFFSILCVYTIIISITLTLSSNDSTTLLFIMLVISDIMLLICWHFALSIYKKEKLLFVLCGIGYLVITPFFRIGPFVINLPWLLNHVPIALVLFGIILIIFAEFKMKKKGFLSYI